MRPHLVGLVLLLALLPVSVAAAQAAYEDRPGLPESPAAIVVEALIAAIDADDAGAFLRFLDAHATEGFRRVVPDAEHVAVYREVRSETGGVDLHGHRVYDPPRPDHEHVIIVRDRIAGDWRALVVHMDRARPTKLAGLRFAPARAPTNVAPEPALDEAGIVAALDEHVDRLVAADAFSGAVLLARDGRVLLERAAGRASLRFDVPNRVDTKFNLGSMNKMFTAVAIGRLVQDGTLAFDDTIDRWIDETWLPRAVTERIEVRHLLTHTSGLGSYFTEDFMNASRARFRAIDITSRSCARSRCSSTRARSGRTATPVSSCWAPSSSR